MNKKMVGFMLSSLAIVALTFAPVVVRAETNAEAIVRLQGQVDALKLQLVSLLQVRVEELKLTLVGALDARVDELREQLAVALRLKVAELQLRLAVLQAQRAP